jgi:hypothetical protein
VSRVVAIILHALPGGAPGPLEQGFEATRAANARKQAAGLEAAGATPRIIEVAPGGAPFGARLRRLSALDDDAGIIVLGSGSIPLAQPTDWETFVAAAGLAAGPVVANNRYSADCVALPPDVDLRELPDLTADNGLPRWLADAGRDVRDLRGRWRLQVDLDSPLDTFLTGLDEPEDYTFERVRAAAAGLRSVTANPTAELLVAGRTSSTTLRWLERSTASRTRSLVEERGLRTSAVGQRPPRSALGLLIDRDGPGSLGRIVGELADGAVIDTRVLMAHRLGAEQWRWPSHEDRFASDLLYPEAIRDRWLAELTRAAVEAPIPIMFGAHTLVGPGLRLLFGRSRSGNSPVEPGRAAAPVLEANSPVGA